MILTDQLGNVINLGSRLGGGGEAQVFEVTSQPDMVGKIYHCPSAERTAKLKVMIAAPPTDPSAAHAHRSFCWPTSLLFDQSRLNIGFLMPRVGGGANRAAFLIWNPQDRKRVAPCFSWQYLMRTAVNVASVVSAAHARGYVIGDLNESNMLVSDSALVSLVDCDSMQVPQPGTFKFFRCPVGKPEFTAPELQGCDFGQVDRNPEHDNFGLGVLIFQLLMEGTHPFSGVWQGAGDPPPIEERIRRGWSPYFGGASATPMPAAPALETLPVSLQTLFHRCFRDGQSNPAVRPNAKEWQAALALAESNLATCPRNGLHAYSAHLPKCPWCERARLLGGIDPFPGTAVQRPLVQKRLASVASATSSPVPTPTTRPIVPTTKPAMAFPAPATSTHRPKSWAYAGVALVLVIVGAVLHFKAIVQAETRQDLLGVHPPQASTVAPMPRKSRSTFTKESLIGRWVNRPANLAPTTVGTDPQFPVYYVFLADNRLLIKNYGDNDPGAPVRWQMLGDDRIQVDSSGPNNTIITTVYQLTLGVGQLLLECLSKDWHGTGSGGCPSDQERFSLASKDVSLNIDERTSIDKLTPSDVAQNIQHIQAPPKVAHLSREGIIGHWKWFHSGAPDGEIIFKVDGRYEMPHDGGPISGPYSLDLDLLIIEYPEVEFTAEIVSVDSNTIVLRQTKSVDRAQGNSVSYLSDTWQLTRN